MLLKHSGKPPGDVGVVLRQQEAVKGGEEHWAVVRVDDYCAIQGPRHRLSLWRQK